jgi:hypothetical protein
LGGGSNQLTSKGLLSDYMLASAVFVAPTTGLVITADVEMKNDPMPDYLWWPSAVIDNPSDLCKILYRPRTLESRL